MLIGPLEMARYLIAAALVAAVTTQATVGHGPAMEAAIRAATSASSRTRIHCARAHVAKLPSRMQIRPDTKPAGWWQQNGWAPPSARTPLVANLVSTGCSPDSATNHQRSCSASHSSPSSAPACAASVLAHAPERGTQAGELLLQTRSGPATGTCSEADDGDDASEADDVAARQFAGLTRLQLDEVGRERQVQQQGRQRAEAPAERSVEIAQAMVPLAGALARGGG